jgi:hypothetical protein
MMRLLLIALFLEVGLVLAVVPWSAYWEQNYFASSMPLIEALIRSNFTRGAVSGLGLVNVAVGIAELWSLFRARRFEEPIITISPSSATDD